ncbi:MAG: sulfatase-like hydrolase/transferase [Planctomycetaceae bacterium]
MQDRFRRLVAGVVSLAVLTGIAVCAERPPNVILILADDQGTVDAGCFGSGDLVTPALDQLAAEGVRLTQFYAAAPVCSPSRAGALTGRWPVRAGVPGNCSSRRGVGNSLPPEETTMAEVFRGAGYATAHIGKWHLGYTEQTIPQRQGFDLSFGHMGGCIDNYSHFFFWAGPNTHDLWRNGQEIYRDGGYFPDLMLQEATQFIRGHQDQPFFMYYAMNTPHYPYQGDAHWLEHFAEMEDPGRLFAGFLAAQDQRLQGLLRVLQELDLRRRTIIVYQSDNGHSTEERAHFGGGSAGRHRGAKFSLLEGGIRVPAVISWPGELPAGEVRDQAGHACDWLPTLTELAGVNLPDLKLDGLRLTDVLKTSSAKSPHQQQALHWQVGTGSNADWAVRLGDWKLIGRTRDTGNSTGKWDVIRDQLFDLGEDPEEQVNLAEQHPEMTAKLRLLHESYLTE